MQCYDFNDFKTMVLKNISKEYRNKVTLGTLSKEEYLKIRTEASENAQKLWEQLIQKNEKFYKKDDYLDIEYLADKNIYRRVPLKKGRPKQEEKKENRVTVRLDKELQDILDKYCEVKGKKESEAIRDAIMELKLKTYC